MNFVYFSTLAWEEAGGAHNQTQSALALARRGHAVLFVEPQMSARRETEGLPVQIVALTELGMTPTELRRAWFGLDAENIEEVAEKLTARIPQGGGTAVYCAPFDPMVRLAPVMQARGYALVYNAIDDFAAAPMLGYTQFSAGAEEYLARESDLIVAVTPHIAKTFEGRANNVRVLPNGIDVRGWDEGNAKPAEIRHGTVTVGFWGTVMDAMFDAGLVAHAAQEHPDWVFHLLGRVDPEPHRPSIATQLKPFSNVVLHGPVPHGDLAGYAAAFDVCIAPFPDNAFTHGRDPIKVYEYLAAHKPVVASYASQLENVPYVTVACAPDEFVSAIEQAATVRVDAAKVDAYLAAQSWDARVGQLLEWFGEIPPKKVDMQEAKPLTSFVKPDVETVMRYANALETELEQVQGWAREMEAMVRAKGGAGERLKRLLPALSKRR